MRVIHNKSVLITLLSALFIHLVLLMSSFTPIIEYGERIDTFGNVEMWVAIVFISLLYITCFALYNLGLNFMKYIMAVFCGIGILMMSIIFIALCMNIFVFNNSSDSIIITMVFCTVSIFVNIMWFNIVLSSPSGEEKAEYYM
ncbi:DUF5391 family protein [Alkalihalobacillus trypoxylicola]|uniref:DUF5391 family protein n=1 Tax=Alkalihalobacillus trypoxylicola TaxID=519424 RepID=UPI000A9DAF09|nr:DUF5391 family protein [Alkalihalobacillus trypoxylicola]